MQMVHKPKIAVLGLYGASLFFGVENFPRAGETVVSEEYLFEPGGKGYNQAVAAARLGASVCFITSVGNDAFGHSCQDYLKAEGITEHFIKQCSLPTASASIIYDSLGTSRVIVYPGASLGLTREDLFQTQDLIANCDFLLLQNELPVEILSAAVELAAELGVQVIFNPAPAGEFESSLLEKVYAITPNEGEAAVLAGLTTDSPPQKLAEKLHLRGAQKVIITLGERGVYVSAEGRATHLKAMDVQAVDTTGAGDTFNAALAVSLARGFELSEAARYAVVASGLAVTKRGVMAAIPSKENVDLLYNRS